MAGELCEVGRHERVTLRHPKPRMLEAHGLGPTRESGDLVPALECLTHDETPGATRRTDDEQLHDAFLSLMAECTIASCDMTSRGPHSSMGS
ncbi:hypothetical protein GCM10025869_33430 [Homoserinibacter gongjuensis]|uniref:Uncharacterized protein n=1 Tax=Homoserinibacter gongjuensis TaxID=1162968 RepID=A0ABQ6K050_9MICO|nr:hypothetical protein GCM10025869_33430 [Homoserinibacter gongjuensis]